MRASRFPFHTLKQEPADAEVVSHRLMLRAGLIRKLSSGLYLWLPTGLRVLRKVGAVVREEMDAAGACELLMPAVQPADLWRKSGRWDKYGAELLRIKDRHRRDFVFGPTHEEVICHFARGELSSYRQLPVNYYQIQTKFRDEIRPRFGIMRAREFLMKDAYSFHCDDASLDETYRAMFSAYARIFERLGLGYRAVLADTGAIGGDASHEFHVLADTGEDRIAFSDDGDYAANVELAPTASAVSRRERDAKRCGAEMHKIETPGATTIQALATLLNLPARRCLKALFVNGADGGIVGIFVRGDHELNVVKAARHPAVADPLTFADERKIVETIGCAPGSLGPVGLRVPVLADHAAAEMADFATGANEEGYHLVNVNWGRDLPEPETGDFRNVEEGDPGPDGRGRLHIRRGIEVGHIFKLGTRYSEAMDVSVLDEAGKPLTVPMGCYGIGISRIVAAAIEQNHDKHGIVWPPPMAPFEVALTPVGYHRNPKVKTETDRLYQALLEARVDVLLDDRDARPGVLFADGDLIGLPWRLVVSEKNLANGHIECLRRHDRHTVMLPLAGCVEAVMQMRAEATT